MLKSLFSQLGANEKESNTYLKLLELGATHVSHIAKILNIPRATMYLIIDKLEELQLAEHFIRNGIKYVKAIPPKEIINLL
ncbi:hypothetical protein HY605_06075, partial [Candidatus Peregrinibacteria bacterium]|nr:hypothetical protein [Candidatus Peregrinibacteria bacterium]